MDLCTSVASVAGAEIMMILRSRSVLSTSIRWWQWWPLFQSGVGRKSATSVGLTTDLVHWLQAGKTVAVVRFASKFHRLASAFRTASVASLPAAIPPARPAAGRLPATAGHRAAVVVLRIHCGCYEDSMGLHQSERQ